MTQKNIDNRLEEIREDIKRMEKMRECVHCQGRGFTDCDTCKIGMTPEKKVGENAVVTDKNYKSLLPDTDIVRRIVDLCDSDDSGEIYKKVEAVLTHTLKVHDEEMIRDIIKMADALETECGKDGDKGTKQWMAFKGFRNTIRDKYIKSK